MALIVQNDTGTVALADSYQSLAELTAYATARGWTAWLSATVDKTEQAAREATLYLDTVVRYKGAQLTAGQATEWPREGVSDWSSRDVTGIPSRIKRAHSLLAFRALSESLYVDLDRGGRIASESVSGVSVSYFADAPEGKAFREAMALIEPFVREKNALFVGNATPEPEAGMFSIGMHDGTG